MGKYVRSTFDQNHFAAKAANDLRHLYANRPASNHEQSARDTLQAGHLTVCPDKCELSQAWHWRDDRLGTHRYDYVFGRITDTVDFDYACPSQPTVATKQMYAMLDKPMLLALALLVTLFPNLKSPRTKPESPE